MRKAVVLGHFAFGHDKTNGQTIKTKTVTAELEKVFGKEAIGREDTMGRWKFLLRIPAVVLRMLRHYQNIIILPAYKGVRVVSPLLVLGNLFFHRRLHYVVIGGWLPQYADKYPLLRWTLRHFDGIYVETQLMRSELARHKFNNLYVMPNCKELNIIGSGEMPQFTEKPYRLCTFSRVMEEKGIADAVEAVEACNREEGETLFTLDIYGPVVEQEWFDRLMAGRQHCRYAGVVPFNQTTQTLKDYFALLFPTYYHGEGFAGTIIDALSAGLPTIVSSWKANAEFIEDGKTGLLFVPRSTRELTSILRDVGRHPEKIQAMRHNCLRKANDYQPAAVINTLVDRIK